LTPEKRGGEGTKEGEWERRKSGKGVNVPLGGSSQEIGALPLRGCVSFVANKRSRGAKKKKKA